MNRRRAITVLDIAALTVATIGALNWGFSAVNFNLVRRLFGRGSLMERTVYLVVGLAGIDLAWLTARFIAGGYQTPAPSTEEMRQRLAMEAQQLGQQVQRGAQQAGRQAQRVGQEIQQTGQEVQRGSYRQPGMRP